MSRVRILRQSTAGRCPRHDPQASVWLTLAVLLTSMVIVMVIAALPRLADRLVDCPRGHNYSIKHLRCVGNLEFDRR